MSEDNFKSALSDAPNLIDTLATEGERQDKEPHNWPSIFGPGMKAAASAYETYGDSSRVGAPRLLMASWEDALDKRARIISFDENVERASYNYTKTTFRPVGRYGTRIDWLLSLCDSPIEVHMFPWLVINDYWPICSGVAWADVHAKGVSDKFPIVICPQVPLFQYRIDFGIFATFKDKKKLFAFECDGAAFHDDSRDHIRDMALLRRGVQTIRASGTEIYNDPAACARRVTDAVANWSKSVD